MRFKTFSRRPPYVTTRARCVGPQQPIWSQVCESHGYFRPRDQETINFKFNHFASGFAVLHKIIKSYSAMLFCIFIISMAFMPVPTAAAPQADSPSQSPSVPQYNLRQLVEMARTTYPGIKAAQYAIEAMEQQVFRANWAWLPQGTVKGLVAPAPKIQCSPSTSECTSTNVPNINSFIIDGILSRIELEVGMPIYTFGKLRAAKDAAAAGLEINKEQLRSAQDKLIQDITKAYWGIKLAREIILTIDEGRGYLDDAEKKVQEDVEQDGGEYTMTDLLRLRSVKSEIDVRSYEALKLAQIALASLGTLIGQKGKAFDVDTEVIDVFKEEPLALNKYLQLAHQHRPELRMLEMAMRASNAAVDLERARLLPDFLLVATIGYGYTSSVDKPENAFYNNPFNFMGAGFGLALHWKFDHLLQYSQYRTAKANKKVAQAKQAEALAGIDLEIKKAWLDLKEARSRLDASAKGERSGHQWLVAVSQNLAAGLSEPRDLTDALTTYFQLRLRYLQAIYDVNVGWSELGRVIGMAGRKPS